MNPGSMEAGQDELTRVTCFLARRLELDAAAGLLWLSWCVLGWGGGFFRVFFFSIFFFFERTRPATSIRPPLASFTSLLEPGAYRVQLFHESVCLCVCVLCNIRRC